MSSDESERALIQALVVDRRRAVDRLRDDRLIDDSVYRRVQLDLDHEDVRLRGEFFDPDAPP